MISQWGERKEGGEEKSEEVDRDDWDGPTIPTHTKGHSCLIYFRGVKTPQEKGRGEESEKRLTEEKVVAIEKLTLAKGTGFQPPNHPIDDHQSSGAMVEWPLVRTTRFRP